MNPKIDDLYYCKKPIISIMNNRTYFEKGKKYRVIYQHHGEVIMTNDIGNIVFSLENNMHYDYFYEYFGTIKDERKDKLNKLNYEIPAQ